MQTLLPKQQKLLRFYMIGIRHAAIHRTDRRTLRLFVKADTFRTFIGYDIVIIVRNGHLLRFCIHHMTATIEFIIAFHRVAVADCPFYTAFINGIIGAFRLASSTVNAIIRNHYRHNSSYFFLSSKFVI